MARIAKIVNPVLLAGSLLWGASAFAGPGGLPACMAGLSTCTSSLNTCDNSLSSCNSNLSVAQNCGNGVIDAGEQCDQSNLNFQTCSSQGFAAGTLKCGAGCVFDTSGCSENRFIDNGDGTASDLQTGLMWEKKTLGQCVNLVAGKPIACVADADCTGNAGGGVCESCPRCVNALYTWTASGFPYPPTGTAFTSFLYALNGGTSTDGNTSTGCFAGHCDWRLPTYDELYTLASTGIGFCGSSDTCTDPALGISLNANIYWTGTTGPNDVSTAWAEELGNNIFGADTTGKTSSEPARAVRSGL
jgi:hypothetical protein